MERYASVRRATLDVSCYLGPILMKGVDKCKKRKSEETFFVFRNFKIE